MQILIIIYNNNLNNSNINNNKISNSNINYNQFNFQFNNNLNNNKYLLKTKVLDTLIKFCYIDKPLNIE